MSLAVLIMQIQGQLKNLQVVRDLQGQGIYHYSWVAVEVTIIGDHALTLRTKQDAVLQLLARS